MNAHIAAQEPYLAFNDIGAIVSLWSQLTEVSLIAQLGGATGFNVNVSLTPLEAPLSALIVLAKTMAAQDPEIAIFQLLANLHAASTELQLQTQIDEAAAALVSALTTLLGTAEQACLNDPDQGEGFLDIVRSGNGPQLLVYGENFLPGITAKFEEAWAACRIRITPNPASVALFESLQFSGHAVGLAPQGLTWSIQGTAGQATIDSTGLFSGPNVIGRVFIVGTSDADSTRYRRVPLDVVTIDVKVTPATSTIDIGRSQQFTATVTGPQNTAVTWSSTGGFIDSNGLFGSSTAGTFTVRATSVLDSNFFGEATVTVNQPQGQPNLYAGQLTLSKSPIPGYGGGTNVTIDVLAVYDPAIGFPEVEDVLGPATILETHPAYCNPIYSFQGEMTFGEMLFNDSGFPGDLILNISGAGTATGASPVLVGNTYVCQTGSYQSTPYVTGLIGTLKFNGSTLTEIDFNRNYTLPSGVTVTTTGKLTPLFPIP
jgi:hypothetical protein